MTKPTFFQENVNSIKELIEMIETADRAMNREDPRTEGYSWYESERDTMRKTLKRMVNNCM